MKTSYLVSIFAAGFFAGVYLMGTICAIILRRHGL